MAVNDVQYELGSATLYNSSGTAITVLWGLGSVMALHEYVAAAPSVFIPRIIIT